MNILNFGFSISEKIRFLIIGTVNASFSYGIYSIICLIFGEKIYQTALGLSWVLSSVLSFSLQKNLVFRSKNNWFKEYLKCCTTWIISYILNAVLLEIFVRYLCINIFFAQLVSTLLAAILTYILFKFYTFKNSENLSK